MSAPVQRARAATEAQCPQCSRVVYRRVVLTEVTVLFDSRLEYDGMYFYRRRHRCGSFA